MLGVSKPLPSCSHRYIYKRFKKVWSWKSLLSFKGCYKVIEDGYQCEFCRQRFDNDCVLLPGKFGPSIPPRHPNCRNISIPSIQLTDTGRQLHSPTTESAWADQTPESVMRDICDAVNEGNKAFRLKRPADGMYTEHEVGETGLSLMEDRSEEPK